MPAPTIATSAPWFCAGMLPSPAGCSIQSSKAKGKSGPKNGDRFFYRLQDGDCSCSWLTLLAT
ncbi:hypothetical protein ACFS4T_31625 [Pseudomonas lini]